MSLKTQALLILFSMTTGALIAWGGSSLGLYSVSIGAAAVLVCLCLGFAAVGRLRCPGCGGVLARSLPAGALILLPFAKHKCPRCGTTLP